MSPRFGTKKQPEGGPTQQAMPHPYLPELKSGIKGRFKRPTERRVWEERARSELGILGDSIEVPSTEHRIHSIPDPWARVILFDRALYDDEHIMHGTVLGEWRGLLALLGLRERRGYSLSARKVKLGATKGAPPGTFSAVLKHLEPSSKDEDLISSKTTWEEFYIFKWQRPSQQTGARAFAMTSPATLVCTGADYRDVLRASEVEWFQDGLLRDPRSALGHRERLALAEWLLAVTNTINKSGEETRSNKIVAALQAFAKDLQAGVSPAKEFGATTLNMNYGLYVALDLPCKPEKEVLTDLEIVARPGAPRYVLIDNGIANHWQKSESEITVHRNVTLATCTLTAGGATEGPLPGDGLRWCTPQALFADRLIYDPGDDTAFPGCRQVEFTGAAGRRNVVLPLTELMLKLFTPEDIAKNLTIQWMPNGNADCRFKLFLKPGKGDGKEAESEYIIQQTYSDSEMVRIANLPMLCVWPDFRVKDGSWRTFYTFQAWLSEKKELRVTPWSSGQAKAEHREFAIDSKTGTRHRFQIHGTQQYPEAFVCKMPYVNHQRDKHAVGILLPLPPNEKEPPTIKDAVVGVDFGSTGSNVFLRQGKSEPKAVVFDNRITTITAGDKTQFPQNCQDFFIPDRDWSAESILSVFFDFGEPDEGERATVLDGHVLFADDPREVERVEPTRVMANLKWGAERERIAAGDFLMQLCFETAAELVCKGVSEADIRFSYPTAFSEADLETFKAKWESVQRKVTEVTGVMLHLNKGDIDNREAVVATRFFSENKGQDQLDVEGGALTMDVGGGTTDFAIWRDSGLQLHSSVILAGRDILLAPIRTKPQIIGEILDKLANEIGLNQFLGTGRNDGAAFNVQLDAVVAKYGDKMIERLHLKTRDSVKGLLEILEIGLCGLTFYGGLLVRRLAAGDKFNESGRVDIFVGGNGSKMFRWCSLGTDLTPRSEIHRQAAKAFLAGAGLKDLTVEIHLSAKPKSEVAWGLVCEKFPFAKDADDADVRIAGESFKAADVAQDWNAPLPPEEIEKFRVKVDRSFPMFTLFLSSIGYPVDKNTLDKIGGAVDTRLRKQAQEIEGVRSHNRRFNAGQLLRNEPLFIIALKRYLEMKTDEWARLF